MEEFQEQKDLDYIKKFKDLPQNEDKVIASSIEPNKFHKGEFVIKEIKRNDKGREYASMTFIDKIMVRRILSEVNR